jgi:hypothetical protein
VVSPIERLAHVDEARSPSASALGISLCCSSSPNEPLFRESPLLELNEMPCSFSNIMLHYSNPTGFFLGGGSPKPPLCA